MRYLIREEQVAALNRVLGKMRKARPGEIIGLTEREMQAWEDKIPLYESPVDLDVINPIGRSPLTSMVTPTPEKVVAEREKQKKTLVRWMKINKEDNSWTAGVWGLATPSTRKYLTDLINRWQAEPELVGSPSYEYLIDEREMQDDENY